MEYACRPLARSKRFNSNSNGRTRDGRVAVTPEGSSVANEWTAMATVVIPLAFDAVVDVTAFG